MMGLILVADTDADSRDVGRNRFHAAADELSVLCNTAEIAHRPALERLAFGDRCKRFAQQRGQQPVVSEPSSIDEACEQILAIHGNGYAFDARQNADSKGIRHV